MMVDVYVNYALVMYTKPSSAKFPATSTIPSIPTTMYFYYVVADGSDGSEVCKLYVDCHRRLFGSGIGLGAYSLLSPLVDGWRSFGGRIDGRGNAVPVRTLRKHASKFSIDY
jgi:hypothetical protein